MSPIHSPLASQNESRSVPMIVSILALLMAVSGIVESGGLTPSEVAKLVASDGTGNDYGAYSVAVSGDTVVIGAWNDAPAGSQSGSAYVFSRNHAGPDSWGEVVKLTASDAAAGNYFGFSVAISGDTIVIGSHRDASMGAESGSA